MIDSYAIQAHSGRGLWSGVVKRFFQTLDLHERETASNISESLAVFCEQHPHMSHHALSLLAARSFCVVGDREAARHVLSRDRKHEAHADVWLEVLSAEYPFPELYSLFQSRTLRPLHLKTVGGEFTWVLDLEQIRLSAADLHEMLLQQTLRVLTEKVSNIWNKADGKGTLVVKGLPRVSGLIHSRGERGASQMVRYLQDVLHRCAERNDWAFVPSVLLLDL
jgi:hypothetical protein